jgi:glutaminase
LIQLEQENGRPRNPFINAGAIVMTDFLFDFYSSPQESIVDFVSCLANNSALKVNQEVFESEKQTGHRNYALAHFMKSYNNLNHDVEDVLQAYFYHCSIEMNCLDLARATTYLANQGFNMQRQQVIDHKKVRRINALMLTCGVYDDAGEFAYKIGLPTKSGVGGGIVGVLPGQFSVAVWSPALNRAGNSYVGTKALELLTTKLDTSIF